MKSKIEKKATRRGFAGATSNDRPLVRVLIAEATRRGDTLTAMAAALGVTYEHVAQWRRNDSDVSRASRSVIEAAAEYLGIPTVMVLCLTGTIALRDLNYPGRASLDNFVRKELARLRTDPYFAGFFPQSLLSAPPELQHFVVMLYAELSPVGTKDQNYQWMRAIHLAALGNTEAEAQLAALRGAATIS